MQYILTQKEYEELLQKIKDAKATREKIVNKLCQMVSDNMLLTTYPGTKEEPEPWVCRLSKAPGEWYCDGCPVVEYCGMNKHYSV